MNQVIPHKLWLGHANDGRDFRVIFDSGIRALVHLAAEEPPLAAPRDLVYCRFPIVDGASNRSDLLFLAITTIATLIKTYVPTLVFCGGGMSRSPALTAAALALLQEESPETCLERVAEHHGIDVSPGLWQEVKMTMSPQ